MNNTTMNIIMKKMNGCGLLTVIVAVCALLSAGCSSSNTVANETPGTINGPDSTSTINGPGTTNETPGTINGPDANGSPGTTNVTPADPLASGKTRAVYNYLSNLPNGSAKRILSGQYAESMSDIMGILSTTGKNVALLGMDYAWTPLSDAEVIAWSDAGGLVTVGQHFRNPATGRDVFDTTSVNMIALVTEGTALNTTFKGYLDTLATHLSTFQNANAVIILRLFHEMNGGWFWWGEKDPTQYKNVWKYTYNYLTNTKGLHNLIWNWSPYQLPTSETLDTTYYPGAAYVDIAGVSIYGRGNIIPAITGIPDNKPFAINEWGYHPGGMTYQYSSYPPANIAPLISSLKTNMPNAVYWMAWNGIYSMNYNTNTSTLLTDPWVITRDEIPVFGVTIN